MSLKLFFFVAVGGAAGALARYIIQNLSASLLTQSNQWSTVYINVVGCFLIGWLLAQTSFQNGLRPEMKALLVTGFCGGFTTFSAFGWENWQLLQQGRWSSVFWYSTISIVGGILATILGYKSAT
jgi:CrcB protein